VRGQATVISCLGSKVRHTVKQPFSNFRPDKKTSNPLFSRACRQFATTGSAGLLIAVSALNWCIFVGWDDWSGKL
jgi:hypothetical protein